MQSGHNEKKETFWQLLERLDKQAGEFNGHLEEANRYFDKAADSTRKILVQHEKDLHITIGKLRRALKKLKSKKETSKKNNP